MTIDFTANEPLTRKRRWHKAKIPNHDLGESQPEHGANAVYSYNQEYVQRLSQENQQLRCEKSDEQAWQLGSFKGFVTSVAVVEVAVDVREAELHCGLSNMGGIQEEMKEQEQQMMHFSNDTSRHVSRLIRDMLEQQQSFLNNDQQRTMLLEFESAHPRQAVRVI